MRTKRIGVLLHGVTLNLLCDHGPLLMRVAELLGDHVREPWKTPDLEVEGHWLSCGPTTTSASRSSTSASSRASASACTSATTSWCGATRTATATCRCAFRRLPSGKPAFDVAYQYKPSTKKLAKYDDFEGKKYFDLTRYLVWFPVAWYLERMRGWEMLHASAVSDGERCVLIAGPGGAGKTTTCIGLMARAGMRLVSENLVFVDGERILPVPEPIRLTDESLALLGDSAGALQRYQTRGGLKRKTMFSPPSDATPSGVKPAALFLTRFSRAGYAEPIPAGVAAEWGARVERADARAQRLLLVLRRARPPVARDRAAARGSCRAHGARDAVLHARHRPLARRRTGRRPDPELPERQPPSRSAALTP